MQRDAKHLFRIGMIVLLFLVIAVYAFFQSRKIFEGPEIVINSPKNGSTVYDSLLAIDGRAKNINSISLDDRPIFIDEQGNFNEKLLLYPGYNIMKFEAKDKFGKDQVVMLAINYDAPALPLAESATSSVSISASSTATSTISATSSTSSLPH